MARVQVNRTSPDVQLQPQANPVNTYSQPEALPPSQTEMRAKILEGALSNVSAAVTKRQEEEYRQQMELAKEEIAMTSSADFIQFKQSISKELETLNPTDSVAFIDKKFNERYKDIPNPYVATALMGLKTQFTARAAEESFRREEAARAARFADATFINVAEVLKTANTEGWDDARLATEIDSLYSVAKKGGMTGEDFNVGLMRLVGDDDPNQRGWRYIQSKKLDKTANAKYEPHLNAIQRKQTSDAATDFKFALNNQLNTLVQQGAELQVKKTIEEAVPTLKKLGIDPSPFLAKVDQARTEKRRLINIQAHKRAVETAVAGAIQMDGFVPEVGFEYVDAEGQTKTVSPAEIKRGVVQKMGTTDLPNKAKILTQIGDPQTQLTLNAGIGAIADMTDGTTVKLSDGKTTTKKQIAATKFGQGIKAFQDLYSKDPEAARKQAGSSYEVYIMAMELTRAGVAAEDVGEYLQNYKAGSRIKVPQDASDSMVQSVIDSNGGGVWGFFNDEAQNTDYIRARVGMYYQMVRGNAVSDELAAEAAVKAFNKSHTLVDFDGTYILINHNFIERNKKLGGGSPQEMVKRLGTASKQLKADYEREFPDAFKEDGDNVMLVPSLLNPNMFVFKHTNGKFVVHQKMYTAEEVFAKSQQWESRKSKKAAATATESEIPNSP